MLASKVEILNESLTPPFMLDDDTISEAVRLEYRFIDLRRDVMQRNLKLRNETSKSVRNFLDKEGFIELETPILNRSTPEGARDYLVPQECTMGSFLHYLNPHNYLNRLLMVSGFDRYYQIAKCFRDEDLRADRQPEFTQIDIEASFIDEEKIIEISEKMIRKTYLDVLNINLSESFPKISYKEAMSQIWL